MSNQDKYYEHKVREIERRKEKEQKADILQYSLYAAAALAFLAGILFLASPGVIATYLTTKALSTEVSKTFFWIAAAGICLSTFGAIYLLAKNSKKSIAIYLVICAASSVAAIYARDIHNQSIAEHVINTYLLESLSIKLFAPHPDAHEGASNPPLPAASIPNQNGELHNTPVVEAQPSAPEQQEQKQEAEATHDNVDSNDIAVKSTDPNAQGMPTSPASKTSGETPDAFGYLLQTGAYGTQAEAEQQRAQLTIMGLEPSIQDSEVNGRSLFRVRLGPFAHRGEAEEVRIKLQDSGLDSTLVRIQKK
jgi:cell division septation protein DedD